MSWINADLCLFHGTDDGSARHLLANGVDLTKCSPLTDFGRGFYATTNYAQAVNWGSNRARARRKSPGNSAVKGSVVRLGVSRDWLATLNALVFVRSREPGWSEFVRFCRVGRSPHRAGGDYDVVYGPVSQWQDFSDPSLALFTIEDCDQISFHTAATTALSSPLFAAPSIAWSEP